jgi:hypothetical protein
MPFRRIILGKFWLSADFTIGKPALMQNNLWLHAFPRIIPRKGMPFRGIIRGKFWLSENYTPERHAFPRYNPRKVLTFRGLSTESQTKFTNISANSRKNIKQFLDVHQGPIRCWLMKKNETKKSHATVPLNSPTAERCVPPPPHCHNCLLTSPLSLARTLDYRFTILSQLSGDERLPPGRTTSRKDSMKAHCLWKVLWRYCSIAAM